MDESEGELMAGRNKSVIFLSGSLASNWSAAGVALLGHSCASPLDWKLGQRQIQGGEDAM
jgi:hypothetical protein